MPEALLVNLIGPPCSGKSTMAAGLFASLKRSGVSCELVPEVAKDLTWSKRYSDLEDQVYLLGKQHHRIYRLKDQVDVIITDSPLLLSVVYGTGWGALGSLSLELHQRYRNLTYVIERSHPYELAGRNETEEEAAIIGDSIRDTLDLHSLPYTVLPATPESEQIIIKDVQRVLAGVPVR